jgi:hypothetical protein
MGVDLHQHGELGMISLALEIARRKRLGHVFLGLDPSGRAIFTARIPVMRRAPSVMEILRDQRGTVGTFYSSASDGYIYSDHAVYATAQSGGGTLYTSSSVTLLYAGQGLPTNYRVYHSHLYTDTSTLGAGAIITAASLFVYVGTDLSDTDFNLTVVSSTASDPLTATVGNWAAIGATSFGSVSTSGISTVAYTEIALNASGIANINKTAATQWGLRSDRDISATTPTGWEVLGIRTSEQTGTDQDPYLSVTYTTATAISVADTCTFTDAIGNITVSFTVADAVTATDAIGGIEARVTVADTMTATDSPAITAYVTVADGLTATDGLQITVNVTVADAVTAADVVAVLDKLYPHLVNLQSGTYTVVLQSGKFIVNLQSGTRTVNLK